MDLIKFNINNTRLTLVGSIDAHWLKGSNDSFEYFVRVFSEFSNAVSQDYFFFKKNVNLKTPIDTFCENTRAQKGEESSIFNTFFLVSKEWIFAF